MSTKHKEVCLSIAGPQSVRLEKGTIGFKNHFKQIPVPFKIYADFECRVLKFMKDHTQRNIKTTILLVLLTKLFVLMINLLRQ